LGRNLYPPKVKPRVVVFLALYRGSIPLSPFWNTAMEERRFVAGETVIIDYPMSGNHGKEMTVLGMIQDIHHGLLVKCTWKEADGVDRIHEYTVKILRRKL